MKCIAFLKILSWRLFTYFPIIIIIRIRFLFSLLDIFVITARFRFRATKDSTLRCTIIEGLLTLDPDTNEVELNLTTCTVCDADSIFCYRYFGKLSWRDLHGYLAVSIHMVFTWLAKYWIQYFIFHHRCFFNEKPESRYAVCCQSPLFYNITLDKMWFFTRVMGILRSYFMVGFL